VVENTWNALRIRCAGLELRTVPILSALVLGLALPVSAPSADTAGDELPLLAIEMQAETFAALKRARKHLLRGEATKAGAEEEFKARLRFGGGVGAPEADTMTASIRLAARTREELQQVVWPLRIELKGDGQLFGMRRLTLRPTTAGSGLLVLNQLRSEGILVPRSRLARVRLGDRDLGPAILEEHFGKELLESQQRRVGPILRFETPAHAALETAAGGGDDERGFYLARLLPYRAARIASDEALSAARLTATGLMRSFLQGRLPARDLFDLEEMSGFLAVVELWGARNALDWPRLRFYFNPVTQRLEPVAYDPRPELASSGAELVTRRSVWASLLLEDPELRSAFRQCLRRLVSEMAREGEPSRLRRAELSLPPLLRSRDAISDLRRAIARAVQIARIEWKPGQDQQPGPQTDTGPTSARPGGPAEVAPIAALAPHPRASIRAFRVSDAGREYLELANRRPTPMQLFSVAYTGLDPWQRSEFALLAPTRLPLELPPRSPTGRPHFVRLPFRPPRVEPPDLGFEVAIVVEGTEQRGPIEVLPYFPRRHSSPVPTAGLSQTLARHPFLEWDASTAMLRARAGTWEVSGSLVLPLGAGLELPPGTVLQFPDDGLLVASGPLHFRGDAERPVVLEGRPGRGGAGTWKGVVVLESDRPHAWEHVVVRNTEGVERDSWRLTGGVTIRASEVRISQTTFEGHRGEDALNLIRSSFELDQVTILDTRSDAFDCDFCSGRVTGGRFARIGGDAIDVSGSEILVEGSVIEDVRDKALSVGERSRLTARRVELRGIGTAVAGKDGSEIRLEDSTVTRVRHAALMAYTKKSEYGPARVIARNVRMQEIGRIAVAQRGSSVSIDGVEQPPEDIDVDALYRHGYMKK